jgi:hypothetical protein
VTSTKDFTLFAEVGEDAGEDGGNDNEGND